MMPLYPSESEIAVAILGKRAKEWPSIARFLTDKHALPRVDELMGGRFWPAVEEYFRRRHGMTDFPHVPVSSRIRVVPFKPDGKNRP